VHYARKHEWFKHSGGQNVTVFAKREISVLKQIDSGKKQRAVAKELGTALTAVSEPPKGQQKIMKLYERSAFCPDRKRLHLGDRQEVERGRKHVVLDCSSCPVMGPVLRENYREFARQTGVQDFGTSSGWLFRF
jgi:hypothetical protein